ncbi:MAG: nucleoside monophosphate kinase [Clostridiales bacterium]|nr:nucleoside monophosphate kinase [Clostridiales bacterium]
MDQTYYNEDIKIKIEKVSVEGSGVIILTGPSSCGKGEIAKELRRLLSISDDRHLSMGDILRNTIEKARNNQSFKEKLSNDYHISDEISILDCEHNALDVFPKVKKYESDLKTFFSNQDVITQLDWLEFCVANGLLIPDEWTVNIINATFEQSDDFGKNIYILDGYPRTVKAAEELVNVTRKMNVPIIKVIHLSITKNEMMKRALGRNRMDDDVESLERRYQFYVDHVQPSIDYLKEQLGSNKVDLIDAHQPIYNEQNEMDLEKSIKQVAIDVLKSFGLPSYLLSIGS